MQLQEMIYKIRTAERLSQAEFAALLEISEQSVQNWEAGTAEPSAAQLVQIASRFGVSLDLMLLGREKQETEDAEPELQSFDPLTTWDSYADSLATEYMQSLEEGRNISAFEEVFDAVAKLPASAQKEKIAEALWSLVQNAEKAENYPYIEPSTLSRIRSLRQPHPLEFERPSVDVLAKKIEGAWVGRICGCLLGKPVEGMKLHELLPFLQETGNLPMHRYIYSTDVTDEMVERYSFRLRGRYRCYADLVDGMPIDDDTTYTVLAQQIIETYGREFTAKDVASEWMRAQPKNAYYTAERAAYRNFVNGMAPPVSAIYKNPYREWIGAQIRGDYFGYINPCDPGMAAEMAFRDASISHTKNGIYGEMFVSAMLAAAAGTHDIRAIISSGLAQIPATSRLYQAITRLIAEYDSGVSAEDTAKKIRTEYHDTLLHHWCHTISNALIVVAALLYGQGDFAASVCYAVSCGFDTDCNGATVGSVMGMRGGIDCIDEVWRAPLKDTLHTPIFGVGTVRISDVVAKTLTHIQM